MKPFQHRYHTPGTAPGLVVEHPGQERHPGYLLLMAYDGEQLEEHQNPTSEDCRARLVRPGVTWLHIQGHADPALLQSLGEPFQLHSLVLEDVANAELRPKLERYEEQLFLTLSLARVEAQGVVTRQVSLFMGPGYVVSFYPGSDDPFAPVRRRLREAAGRIRRRRADYLLYALLDTVVDLGFPVLEDFGERIEDLEMELLDTPDRSTLHRIHALKRDLLWLRRALWPQREVVNALLREESSLIEPDTRLFLRDCYDHSVQILELLEAYRDMSAGMLDVYLSAVNQRLNEIMRLLTVISTIFIPLSFIVGVYGMNFGRDTPRSPWAMPELDWAWGYPLVWLVMAGVALGMLAWFKWRRWF